MNALTSTSHHNCAQIHCVHRALFQDRMDIWEEIEARVNSDTDVAVVKTSNKVGDLLLSAQR